MTAGIVAQIRVNPRNVQLVIDFANKIGLDTTHASWASIVSGVLNASLEAWMSMNILEEPDSTKYWEQAARFEGGKNNRTKRHASNAAQRMAEHGNYGPKVPRWLLNSISAPSDPRVAAADQAAREYAQQEEKRLSAAPTQSQGLSDVANQGTFSAEGIWMGERGGLMSPEDALPEGLSSAGLDQYPEDQTEAHEVPSDDALAVRYLALHTRREAGGLTEGEQAEYLRLNHLLFDGK